MSDILNIGASGVRAYQTALGVVSENIANAGTAGYVRRDARLVESSVSAVTMVGQVDRGIRGGVEIGGIVRQSDVFRTNAVLTATADVSSSEASVAWLERIETSLGSNRLGEKLTGFFNAGTALAADPTSNATRTDFLAKADATATAFRETAQALGTLADEIGAQAGQSVDAMNGLSKSLASINSSLIRAQPGTNAQASLLDQRDRVLQEMSSLGAISVETAANGVATVRLNQPGGPAIVEGVNANTIGYTANASGSIAYTMDPYGDPVAIGMSGGALAGIADASARIADARAQIDGLASDFAGQVNAVQAQGIDLDGNAGGALFAFDADAPAATLAITGLGVRGIAAAAPFTAAAGNANAGNAVATLTIDATAGGLPARDRYVFTVQGGTVTVTDPATSEQLASLPYTPGQAIEGDGFRLTLAGNPASGDSFTVAATGTDSRDNGNLAGLAAIRDSGRYEGRMDALVTGNASTLESRRTLAETQAAIRDNAIEARDSVSAVNLDNEAVELMRFQQAYQASSRIIQVAREMFQTILDAA